MEFNGRQLRIVLCKGAMESFDTAVGKKRLPSKKIKSLQNRLSSYFELLADGETLSRANFVPEGELPRRSGQDNGQFFAVKYIPMRAYGWYSKKHKGTFFISHFVYKDYDDLAPKDTAIVGANWKRIEEDGDEN